MATNGVGFTVILNVCVLKLLHPSVTETEYVPDIVGTNE